MKKLKIPHNLPVAPLVPWIRECVEKETMEGFALRCKVSSRRFNEILNGRAMMMSFDNVDKLLANEGSRTIIDFFPEYTDDEAFFNPDLAKRKDTGIEKKRGCRIEGCERPHHSRGLCNGHYRMSRRGTLVT